MKSTLTAVTLLSLLLFKSSTAQTTYTINPSNTWTGKVGSTSWCGTCTFNISSGQTLTLDYAATCGTCTFTGGNIVITQGFTCQSCSFNSTTITMASQALNLQSSTNSFTNVNFTITGTGSITSTAGISLTNSAFTFSNTSYFSNNGGSYSANNSYLYFNNNAYFTSTSGPMNFQNNSGLIAGDGNLSSGAYIYMNTSSAVNIYDNSMIKVSNNNNYYFNWSSYNSVSNSKTYATSFNNLNCGSGYPNACNGPYLYGCATLNSSGVLACIALELADLRLSAAAAGTGSVALSWSYDAKAGADHFQVQHSSNGQDWTTIGTVTANGYETSDYYFNDPAPSAGANDYRLLVADRNGHIVYSNVAVVLMDHLVSAVSIYPNPVTGHTFFVRTASTSPFLVNVFTLGGQLLFRTSLKGQTEYSVNLPASVTPGTAMVVQVLGEEGAQAFNLLNQ